MDFNQARAPLAFHTQVPSQGQFVGLNQGQSPDPVLFAANQGQPQTLFGANQGQHQTLFGVNQGQVPIVANPVQAPANQFQAQFGANQVPGQVVPQAPSLNQHQAPFGEVNQTFGVTHIFPCSQLTQSAASI